ncbi:MAG: hypothetical protein SFZ23_02650 [Planctomycetota bacterium]|nr:hypothetical protein [Planctomycetota bacterium]
MSEFENAGMPFDGAGDGGELVPPPGEAGQGPDEGGEGGEFATPSSATQLLASLKGQIEQRLAQSAAAMSAAAMGAAFDSNALSENILGVGIGAGADSDELLPPGTDSALTIYVQHDDSQDGVRRELVDSMGVQAASEATLPVQIIKTGLIEAQSSNRSRFRPAPAGVSCGHPLVTAGTIGGWARGLGSRSNRLLLVSNNHVIGASNAGRYGDAILQPGTADGGRNPQDRIAILERFVPINFSGGANFVDAATGWCWPNLVRTDHVYHVGTTPRFFRIRRTHINPTVGMVVGKTGRTTNLTRGTVQATGVSVNVNYGGGRVAHFRDQFSVRVNFSAGGDSGSFVWRYSDLSPVGLLFAGGGGTTFCNRMHNVVNALQIQLV